MAWETFNPAWKRVHKRLPPDTISVAANGMLNASAIHDQLGDDVELTYHPDGLLGLRPVPEKTPISYRVQKAKSQNTWAISLIAFITHYDLEHIKRKRYHVSCDGDLFIIDLNNPIGEVLK